MDEQNERSTQVVKKRQMAEIRAFFLKAAILAVTLWIMFGVVFGITSMKDQSMVPKLAAGDLLLYYRLDHSPKDRDVVVFEKDKKIYVGRVIARGGDTVEIEDGALLQINGNAIVENEIYYLTGPYEGNVKYPVTLAEDELFILCDYREGAKDSRYFGPVTQKELKGIVITAIRRSGI